jgi:hypothetical protein
MAGEKWNFDSELVASDFPGDEKLKFLMACRIAKVIQNFSQKELKN